MLCGYWYRVVGFQLNVIPSTTTEKDEVSKIIKQEVMLSSVVCPIKGFKSMGVKVIKTQEVCEL